MRIMTLQEPARALADETALRLEQSILAGELSPGQKLSEQVLSSQFGVSRGPLREAIRTLEGRHLVERTPFSGVRVVQLTVDDIEQLLFMREALEGMAARQAAENMTLHETRRLRDCLADLEKRFRTDGLDGVFRNGTADNDLHIQIVKGSRNRWISNIICHELYPLLQICRFQTAVATTKVKERAKAVHREHEAIISAIEQRDPDSAERVMREHLVGSRTRLLAELRRREAPGQSGALPNARKPSTR
jgi:DNA-binding GntR family transcriptional regulator